MSATPFRRPPALLLALVASVALGCSDEPTGGDRESPGPPPPPPVGFLRFASIGAGSTSACGLTAEGATYCWGAPDPDLPVTDVPARVTTAPSFTSISHGVSDAGAIRDLLFQPLDLLCGLTGDGLAHCRAAAGGGFVTVPNPEGVAGFATVTSGAPTCGATPAGEAYCWNYSNLAGVLGSGGGAGESYVIGSAVRVAGGLQLPSLSATYGRSCGLTSAGAAYCWGYNLSLEIGDGDVSDAIRTMPSAVAGGLHFEQIVSGQFHTCALTAAGRAYCWGLAFFGEIGSPTAPTADCPGTTNAETGRPMPCVATPAPVAGGLTFSALALGTLHTCGLDAGGRAYCWGSGTWGQLGDGRSGSSVTRGEPTSVLGDLAFRAIAAGGRFTCAIATNDATYCWGANQEGELGAGLGRGTVIARPQPIALPASP